MRMTPSAQFLPLVALFKFVVLVVVLRLIRTFKSFLIRLCLLVLKTTDSFDMAISICNPGKAFATVLTVVELDR